MSVAAPEQGLSSTGETPADLRGQISWALFEFARSPYISLVYVFVFPPYFANVVVGDPVLGQQAWSFANTIVGVCVALLAPLLGAILLLVIVLATCFQFTEVFHNALLASIARADRVGGLSGLGIATGNLGTLAAMAVMLFGVALPASGITLDGLLPDAPLFGLDPATHQHSRIAGPVAGVWFLVFMVPLLLWTPDRRYTGISAGRAIRDGLQQLWVTVKQARRISNVGLFLLARMLYTDGKVAILAYTGIYAAGIFEWDLAALLLFALVLAPFSIAGGFIGGWMDNAFGSKRAIQISILTSCLAMLAAVSITPEQMFFIDYRPGAVQPLWAFPYFRTPPEVAYIAVTMTLAISITAAFCTSRTMMTRIAPVSMMSQFFGLYALSGTATAFLGHALVASFTRAYSSQRAGFASTIILLAAGFLLMCRVRQERAAAVT